MKPSEKALELYKKYGELNKLAFNKGFSKQKAVDCALIAVWEILSLFDQNTYDSRYGYYKEVEYELKRLSK